MRSDLAENADVARLLSFIQPLILKHWGFSEIHIHMTDECNNSHFRVFVSQFYRHTH